MNEEIMLQTFLLITGINPSTEMKENAVSSYQEFLFSVAYTPRVMVNGISKSKINFQINKNISDKIAKRSFFQMPYYQVNKKYKLIAIQLID
jgi:hypothetical protein